MKLVLIPICFIISFTFAQSQTLTDLKINNEATLRFYFGFNSMRNSSYNYEPLQKVPFRTLGMESDVYSFEKGGVRMNMKSKLVDDMIWLLGRTIRKRSDDGPYSISGLFWYKLGFNVKSNSKLNISPGFSISDYLVITSVVDSAGNEPAFVNDRVEEPHGWFYGIGPNLFIDIALPAKLSLHVNSSYDLGLLRLSNKYKSVFDPDYKKPHFLHASVTLNHDSGIFISYEFTKLLDMGYNNNQTLRSELHIGLRKILGKK